MVRIEDVFQRPFRFGFTFFRRLEENIANPHGVGKGVSLPQGIKKVPRIQRGKFVKRRIDEFDLYLPACQQFLENGLRLRFQRLTGRAEIVAEDDDLRVPRTEGGGNGLFGAISRPHRTVERKQDKKIPQKGEDQEGDPFGSHRRQRRIPHAVEKPPSPRTSRRLRPPIVHDKTDKNQNRKGKTKRAKDIFLNLKPDQIGFHTEPSREQDSHRVKSLQ